MASTDTQAPVASQSTDVANNESASLTGPAKESTSAGQRDDIKPPATPDAPAVDPAPEAAPAAVDKPPANAPEPAAPSPATPARPSLVPLGGGTSTSHASSTPTSAHPKKFSTVNINKTFWKQTVAPPGAASTSSPSSTSKPSNGGAGVIARPAVQTATSHSRLVTAKLTATAQPSITTGPGWSRPGSAAPSHASTAPSPIPQPPHGAQPTPGVPPISTSGAPALPHAGKVIQPQPRSVVAPKDGLPGGKAPVWGNVKRANEASLGTNDFPTAAEVAQATKPQRAPSRDKKPSTPAETAAATVAKQEADTFRGVHLNPNAHHWDEMEEGDDDFLGGVIEFGDGRQYKVEATTEDKPPGPDGLPPVSKEERFADDFDRSWPRSATGTAISPAISTREGLPATSPTAPHLQSPTDASRVLFNERSNRLEPFDRGNHNFRQGPHPNNKFGPGGGRDNVQLLHRSDSQFGKPHPPPGGPVSPSHGAWGHDRPRMGDSGPPPSQPPGQHDRGRRFSSNMGPPPVPSDRRPSREGRQLPPHMMAGAGDAPASPRPPSQRRPSSQASVRPTRESLLVSPALSHTSVVAKSPELTAAIAAASPVDLDEARKDLMHSAAERARQRRLEEEAERQRQRERALQKAAELEARMKTAEEAKAKAEAEQEAKARAESEAKAKADAEADAFIRNAIDGAPPSKSPEMSPRSPVIGRQRLTRPPSFRGPGSTRPDILRPGSLRRTSTSSSVAPIIPETPADKVDTWRRKHDPAPPPPTHAHSRPPIPDFTPPTPKPPAPTLPAVVLDHAQLATQPDEVVEEFDFTDMGRFVGAPEPTEPPIPEAPAEEEEPEQKPRRPFEEQRPPLPPTKSDAADTWRRPVLPSAAEKIPQPESEAKEQSEVSPAPAPRAAAESSPVTPPRMPLQHEGQMQTPNHQMHKTPSRELRNRAFAEAPISSLNDAMSRIRGAIDGMHTVGTHHRQSSQGEQEHTPHRALAAPPQILKPPKERWVPPALRAHSFDHEPREVFDVTATEPPRSPKPAWNNYHIKLPKQTQVLPLVPKKVLLAFSKASSMRLDVLSLEGLSRKEFCVEEVLFKQPMERGKPRRPRVYLPKATFRGAPIIRPPQVKKSASMLKPGDPDSASTWRRSVPSTPAGEKPPQLDTTSRSPPPQASAGEAVASLPSPASRMDPDSAARLRSQPKMPAGSGVAFYKDGSEPAAAPPAVTFTVTSELEASKSTALPPPSLVNGRSHVGTSPEFALPSLIAPGKADSKSSPESTDRGPVTPPQASPWHSGKSRLPVKESPARAPDPEHLKAVWSQPANNGLHPINSLEGIADDLQLPFTLQEVKSEDGATPPPSIQPTPSRMSLHDVTRAFQTVPSSSSSSTPQQSSISPPSTASPITRTPSSFSSFTPAPQQNQQQQQHMRPPGYLPYGSPMMSPSPAPVMYAMGNPMAPRPMPNGTPAPQPQPMYGQPVWMPVGPQPAPSPMMRPYPMMAYGPPPTPGAPTMYPAQMQGAPQPQPQPQPQPVGAGRGRGIPPPNGMYQNSPVMMHAPPVMQMPSSPYMSMAHPQGPPGRGGHHPHQGPAGQPGHGPYSGMLPPAAYPRATW